MGTQKAQVHLVPTEDGIAIYKDINNKLKKQYHQGAMGQYHHLYFTINEKGKTGDWVLAWGGDAEENTYSIPTLLPFSSDIHGYRKVVATTNRELYNSGDYVLGQPPIAKIDTPFIEVYIKAYNKGEPIKEVLLEQYWEQFSGIEQLPPKLKLKPNGSVIIHPVKEEMFNKEQVLVLLSEYGKLCKRVGLLGGTSIYVNNPSKWLDKCWKKTDMCGCGEHSEKWCEDHCLE